MAGIKPADLLDAFLAALRATTITTLSDVVWRRGPQRAVRLAGGETALGIVAFAGLVDGETAAGSSNHWLQPLGLQVLVLVPDDETDPGASETTRLALAEGLLAFMQPLDIRSLQTTSGTAKSGRFARMTAGIGPYFEDTKQVFRWVEALVEYKCLRS